MTLSFTFREITADLEPGGTDLRERYHINASESGREPKTVGHVDLVADNDAETIKWARSGEKSGSGTLEGTTDDLHRLTALEVWEEAPGQHLLVN